MCVGPVGVKLFHVASTRIVLRWILDFLKSCVPLVLRVICYCYVVDRNMAHKAETCSKIGIIDLLVKIANLRL
jgi:hypothetical protein